MVRGLFNGLVWGAILGAVGLGFVSLLSPVPPDRAKDVAAAIEAQGATEPEPEPEPEPAPAEEPATEAAPEPAPEPAPDAAPAEAEAEPEEDAAVPAEASPVVAAAEEPAEPPVPPSPAEVVAPEQELEATTEVAAAPPEEPELPEASPAPELATPLPPPPETPAEPTGPGAEAAGGEVVALVLPESGDATAVPTVPQAPTATAPEPVPAAAEAVPAPLPQIVEQPQPEAAAAEPETAVEEEPEAPAAAEADAEVEEEPEMPAMAESEAPADAEAEPDAMAAAEPDQPAPSIGQPYGFGNLAPRVRVNRLPNMGDQDETEAMPADEIDEAAAPEGALGRYAARFENPDAKPLFSVVVLDIGAAAGGLDQEALAGFPFPVSFAVPVDRPDAGERASAFRAAGFEVVMVAGALPQSATPADLEVSFEAFGAAMPETVAVLDSPDNGFQSSRPLAAQVVAILGAEGQGLLTYDRGLNSAAQIAQREGVPSATVFRDLDPEPQDGDTIRRSLDRAALRAMQEGRVIVLARSRPDTVSALFAWALEGRAESVALAPVSAVLKGE